MYLPAGSWLGVVADSPFYGFSIDADHTPGVAETFDLAGLDMVGSVPEPGTMILLGTGIIGLAGTLRRKLLR